MSLDQVQTVMGIRIFIGPLVAAALFTVSLSAAESPRLELNEALTNTIAGLDREASTNADVPQLLGNLITKEFGTRQDELSLGITQHLSWGEITAFAYIQATTGKTFVEMDRENARRDFLAYADNAGMSCEKMAQSLERFLKRAEHERNSLIFAKLRSSRRVYPVPDLGSGFGLFQEALDFRRIDTPRPTKMHDVAGEVAKGEK
jgi:hypothetical protein